MKRYTYSQKVDALTEDPDGAFILHTDTAKLAEALERVLKLCKPMREEWLNDAAFVDACRDYENAEAALEDWRKA
jgi:hypothetical protein